MYKTSFRERALPRATTDYKTMLVSAPVLMPSDLSKEFFLWTDASA